jgi:hypothetical protein
MKATLTVAAFAAALIGTTAFAKDKVEVPAGGPPGAWEYIGTTHAKHMGDHDTIIVAGPANHFRALQVRVTGAPLHMKRMRVVYGNGAPEEIPIRFNIPQGGRSRNIDLRGGDRAIHQIDFWYDTKGWFKGTADVSVFGMH